MNFAHLGPGITGLDAKLDSVLAANREVFAWCLDNVQEWSSKGDIESTIRWASLASGFASTNGVGSTGSLVSERLEAELLALAGRLESAPPTWTPRPSGKRWLHVFTVAYPIFGHTKMCRRMIELDDGAHEHVVVLCDQSGPTPELFDITLRQHGGGRIVRLDTGASLRERALSLRNLARESADVVFLHVHPHDVLSCVAFGIPGGAPVVLSNHADHLFWSGVTIADLVLDMRDSGHVWSTHHRAVNQARIVPIPLLVNEPDIDTPHNDSAGAKAAAKIQLGFPPDAVVLLTVGSPLKYRPFADYDFLSAAGEILARCPNACLLAIGPQPTDRWREASARFPGRVAALGPVPRSPDHDLAADVYLEGFPIGSMTALLESGLAALPAVLTPAVTPLPYTSDGVAFRDHVRAQNTAEYVELAAQFVNDPASRVAAGRRLRQAVVQHHCGGGWKRHFAQALEAVPSEHRIHSYRRPTPLNTYDARFTARFSCNEDGQVQLQNPFRTIWDSVACYQSYHRFPPFGRSSLGERFRRILPALEPLLPTRAHQRRFLADVFGSEALVARWQGRWPRAKKCAWAALRLDPVPSRRRSEIAAATEAMLGPTLFGAAKSLGRVLSAGSMRKRAGKN